MFKEIKKSSILQWVVEPFILCFIVFPVAGKTALASAARKALEQSLIEILGSNVFSCARFYRESRKSVASMVNNVSN